MGGCSPAARRSTKQIRRMANHKTYTLTLSTDSFRRPSVTSTLERPIPGVDGLKLAGQSLYPTPEHSPD